MRDVGAYLRPRGWTNVYRNVRHMGCIRECPFHRDGDLGQEGNAIVPVCRSTRLTESRMESATYYQLGTVPF